MAISSRMTIHLSLSILEWFILLAPECGLQKALNRAEQFRRFLVGDRVKDEEIIGKMSKTFTRILENMCIVQSKWQENKRKKIILVKLDQPFWQKKNIKIIFKKKDWDV